jgi:hypothetical protein
LPRLTFSRIWGRRLPKAMTRMVEACRMASTWCGQPASR